MITSEYKTYIEDVQGVLFMAKQQFDNEQTTKDLFRIGTTEFVNFDIDEWTDEVSNYICIKLTQKAKEKPDTAFYLCELKQMFEAERHATEKKIGSDEFDRDKQIVFGVKFYSDYQSGLNESRKFAKCIDLAIEQLQGESTGTPPPVKLIQSLSENQQKYLFTALTEKGVYFDKDTDYNSFCFVFGNSVKPEDFQPLKWISNVQILRELITGLKHSDIEKITTNKFTLPADYFINKKGEPIKALSGNKGKSDNTSIKLSNILIRLRQTK